MGAKGTRDSFTKRKEQFSQFLDFVGTTNELIILGDLFEGWKLNLGHSLQANKYLLDKMAKMNIIYVPGNHDSQIQPMAEAGLLRHPFFSKISNPFTKTYQNKTFYFCHGHNFDTANSPTHPGIGEILSIATGIFEDKLGSPILKNGKNIEEILVKYAEKFLKYWNFFFRLFSPLPKIDPKVSLTYLQSGTSFGQNIIAIYDFMKKNKLDYLVAGHIHRIGFFKDWYCNTGSWIDLHNEFVIIDDKTGHIDLYNWDNGRPVLIPSGEIQTYNVRLAKLFLS
jgi:UDP-2,3-diacylglucosamine pyrophosphatase LpxH